MSEHERRRQRIQKPPGYGPIRPLGEQPDGRFLWEARPLSEESDDDGVVVAENELPRGRVPLYRSQTEFNLDLEPLERAARRWRRVGVGAGGSALLAIVVLLLLGTGTISTGHERVRIIRVHGEARELVELTEEWLSHDDLHVYDVTDEADWPARFREAAERARQGKEEGDD